MTTRLKCLRPSLLTTATSGWKPDSIRGSRQQRGYGSAWEKRRDRIRERDEELCQPCLKSGRVTYGNEVDHITSKAEARALGWTTEQIEADANLQTICAECHRSKTSRESSNPRGGGR